MNYLTYLHQHHFIFQELHETRILFNIFTRNEKLSQYLDNWTVFIQDIRILTLRKQGIFAYEYCNDLDNLDFIKREVTARGLEYTVEVKNKDNFGIDSIPILKQA